LSDYGVFWLILLNENIEITRKSHAILELYTQGHLHIYALLHCSTENHGYFKIC